MSSHIQNNQGCACTPLTYVAKIDWDGFLENSSHELADNTTKSANFPVDKEPRSLSRKFAYAAEMVELPVRHHEIKK